MQVSGDSVTKSMVTGKKRGLGFLKGIRAAKFVCSILLYCIHVKGS